MSFYCLLFIAVNNVAQSYDNGPENFLKVGKMVGLFFELWDDLVARFLYYKFVMHVRGWQKSSLLWVAACESSALSYDIHVTVMCYTCDRRRVEELGMEERCNSRVNRTDASMDGSRIF